MLKNSFIENKFQFYQSLNYPVELMQQFIWINFSQNLKSIHSTSHTLTHRTYEVMNKQFSSVCSVYLLQKAKIIA